MAKKRLKTLADVRRYLANLMNRLEADEIEEGRAAKLGYLANILISCIKDSDLETRIEALERERKGGDDFEPKASSGAAGAADSMPERWT